jgi:hypothetical protein
MLRTDGSHSKLILYRSLFNLSNRHLLRRDYDLAWMGTNAHFVGGMLGFAYMLACRTYLRYDGDRIGKGIAGLAYAGLFLMVSIVNRGVSQGSGDGRRYGRHIGSLFSTYIGKLVKQSLAPRTFGPMEIISIVTTAVSLFMIVSAIGNQARKAEQKVDELEHGQPSEYHDTRFRSLP